MSQNNLSKHLWTSQFVFIMAAVGSAVGLGNLWKFPYITGENGGGAFVLVYLGCILLVGLPVLLSELVLGRAGKANPVQAMQYHAKNNKASKFWTFIGINGALGSALIFCFYTVIAGWAVAYFADSLQGKFIGIDADGVAEHFSGLLASPMQLLFWHTVVVLFTVYVVSNGIKSGIEKAINFMVPGLLLILLVLLGYATTTGGFSQSLEFLFTPDFSKLSWGAVLVALGHAFFTLSIGMGVMMVYGSYMKDNVSIGKAAIWIAIADTVIALLAGIIIFAIVFANGMEPGAGPGLLFQTLPLAFGDMTGGWFFGTLFFALVVMAALSSAISMIEPAVAYTEQNWGWTRGKCAWSLGGFLWFLGIGTILSFNEWSDVHFFAGKTFFDSLDFLTSSIMLPLGGLFMAIFMGWVLSKEVRENQLGFSPVLDAALMIALKWITPVAVIIVFASNLVDSSNMWVLVGVCLVAYAIYILQVRKKSLAD
ncbi:sodium-dependent transporter [Thiomicrorhabdus sediminis]|uniref:Transporter n=1 Tax=Thiomicrorhabdus sediminis TaxID=2580412 RepID=A0A4V1HHU1_9GAMM|nr:sodium-dependent transporter [Thiomicrorhabdus sediminis]QCU90203.1 sodium-dependent transporter [Thiomicrorhabdus sediminis]